MGTKQKSTKKEAVKSGAFVESLHAKERFEKLSDGWIRDNLLWLDWGPTAAESMNFKAAEIYCAGQGGRLPTIDELRLLIDYNRFNPAINEIFSDTRGDWYWTSSPYKNPNWPGCAWCVRFSSGSVGDGPKGSAYCVRPVRASQ